MRRFLAKGQLGAGWLRGQLTQGFEALGACGKSSHQPFETSTIIRWMGFSRTTGEHLQHHVAVLLEQLDGLTLAVEASMARDSKNLPISAMW